MVNLTMRFHSLLFSVGCCYLLVVVNFWLVDHGSTGGPSPHDGSARPQRLPPPGDGGSGGHGQGSQDDSLGWKREGNDTIVTNPVIGSTHPRTYSFAQLSLPLFIFHPSHTP